MQVHSSSHAVFASVSITAAGTAATASSAQVPERLKGRPSVDRAELHRDHGRDEFTPSARLRQLFKQIDSNGDGGIDVAELGSVIEYLKQQDPSASLPTAEEALARLDSNGDGTIRFRELKRALQSHRRERAHTAHAPEPPPATPPVASPSASPLPPGTPTDTPPVPTEAGSQGAAGQFVAGQFVSISTTLVTIAIHAYNRVAQATEREGTAGA